MGVCSMLGTSVTLYYLFRNLMLNMSRIGIRKPLNIENNQAPFTS